MIALLVISIIAVAFAAFLVLVSIAAVDERQYTWIAVFGLLGLACVEVTLALSIKAMP